MAENEQDYDTVELVEDHGDTSLSFEVTTRGPKYGVKVYLNGRDVDEALEDLDKATRHLESLKTAIENKQIEEDDDT